MEGIRNSILDNCGRYSEDLNAISKKVLETKKFNGEKLTEADILLVDDEIFQAYQTILSTLKDGNSISRAVQMMKNDVETRGVTSDFKTLAVSAVERASNEQPIANHSGNEIKPGEIIVGAVVANEVIKHSDQVLDKVFNDQFVQKMDTVLEKAKTGDVKANAEMETIRKATEFLGKHPKLEGNLDKAALAYMRTLSEMDSPAAKELMEKMAEQYKDDLDIFEKDKDGNEKLSIEKLLEKADKIKNARGENPDYSNIIKTRGEEVVKKGTYTGKDAPENAGAFAENVKRKGRISNLKKVIEKCSKSEDGIDQIKQIYEQYPDEVKEILNQEIDICNKIQETGRGTKALPRHQREVMMLSEVVHAREERNVTHEEKVAKNPRIQEDDELSL